MAAVQPSPIEPAEPNPAPSTTHAPRAPESSRRRIPIMVFILVPLVVLAWGGLMALAAEMSGAGYEVAVAMGIGVGALAALFWVTWYAFVLFAQREEQERRSQH